MIVALAASLAADAARGRTAGYLTSGVFLGILLARPAASLLAYVFDWRAALIVPAVLMAILTATLSSALRDHRPAPSVLGYREAVRSLFPLVVRTPLLRRRRLSCGDLRRLQSLLDRCSLLLASSGLGLTQKGIAFFTLAGAVLRGIVKPFLPPVSPAPIAIPRRAWRRGRFWRGLEPAW